VRLRTITSGLALAALLAVSACTSDGATPEGQDAPSVAAADLDFTATTIDGAPFDGSSLEGEPAVLWFWAPWCPTCIAQGPAVKTAFEDYGDEVNIIGVGGLGVEREMGKFIDRTDTAAITHLVDEEGEVWTRFGIDTQSSYVLIDADGAIVHAGYLDNDALPEQVAALT
jgi:peroxiredoxin